MILLNIENRSLIEEYLLPIPDVLALMFADDISSFADSVVGLQRLINEIEKFCKAIGIEIILNKTKI